MNRFQQFIHLLSWTLSTLHDESIEKRMEALEEAYYVNPECFPIHASMVSLVQNYIQFRLRDQPKPDWLEYA